MVKEVIDFEQLSEYFTGKLTPEDNQRVEEWIEFSEENKSHAKSVYNILYSSATICLMNEIDAGSGLRKVKKKAADKKRKKMTIKWFQWIATILFIPMIICTALYFMPKEKPQQRYIEAVSNFGLISSIELPDGTKIWLNSGSYVKYPVEFDKDIREIYIEGEAYLSVAKDNGKKFIVKTVDDYSIEVLGTEFNIDAYKGNDKITTTLVEGSICLYFKDENSEQKKLFMKPEQQTTYLRNTGELTGRTTYIPKEIAWKSGSVMFRNTPFDEALWILSKRFNVNFTVKKESLHDYSFTGTFTDQNLTRILEHFKISSGINYSQRQIVNDDDEVLKTEIDLY